MSAQQHYGLGAIAAILLAMVFTSLAGAPQGPVQKDAPGLAAKHQVLREALHKDGTTRVLVRLAVDAETLPVPARGPRGQMRRAAPGNQGKQLAQRKRALARAHQRFVQRHNLPPGQAKAFSYVPYAAVEVDAALLAELEASPDVLDITPDDFNELSLSSTLPLIGADVAQNYGWDGSGYDVAILDTGIDSDHPMLRDNIVPGTAACFSNAIFTYDVSLCPSGLDPCRDSNGSPISDSACGDGAAEACGSMCGHGSHVAGIAAGNGSEVGVAPGAGIIPVNVFIGRDTNNNGSIDLVGAYDSDIVRGLEHVLRLAATRDIAAVNMSLGGGIYSTTAQCDSWESATKAVVDDLRALGVATVVAAGNNGSSEGLSSPGCISSVISVGSTNDNDEISGFSNETPAMTLHAPGESVRSAYPGGGTASMSGTSMAAPHVAGAFAVARQLAEFSGADLAVGHIVAALQQTGAEMYAGVFKVPRIQLDDALSLLDSSTPVTVLLDNELHSHAVTIEAGSSSLVPSGTENPNYAADAYGGRALQGDIAGSNRLRFTPTIPVDGYYRVSMIWPLRSGAGNAIDVHIANAQGVAYQVLDQTQAGGRWHDLGTYLFYVDGTNFVEVSDDAGGRVVADAIQLELVGPAEVALLAQSIPSARVGAGYFAQLSAHGGTTPYSWAISNGALPPGLGLDGESGLISGEPTTEGHYQFEVTVTGFEGTHDTQPHSIDVEPYDGILLGEDFADGDLAGWSIVDAAGAVNAPSAWSAAGEVLVQSSNILEPDPEALSLRGTYAVYDGGESWSDYQLGVDISSTDDDMLGAMVRVAGDDNYRFWWSKQSGRQRLDKTVGGETTVLADRTGVPYEQGRTYRLDILAQGSLLEVRIDGELIFSVSDSDLTQGSIALYSYGNDGSRFDNVLVEDLSGTPVNLAPQITALEVPDTLLDDTPATFSVTATDPDGDDQALSYAWAVQPADGSLSGASGASTEYIPADITASQTYSVSITVTDASGAQTTDSRTLTVEDADAPVVLLEDTFADGDFLGWSIVDAPGAISAPSVWSSAGEVLVQSSNILEPDPEALSLRGTYAVYDGGESWSDYQLGVDISSTDDDMLGAMVRVAGDDNYRFWWSKQSGRQRLDKTVGGETTVLADRTGVPYEQGRTYRLEMLVQGSLLEVRIDGELIFSVSDSDLTQGTIALYSYGNAGGYYDNVLVR